MNSTEGIRRIATAIRWIGDGLGLLFAVLGIVFLFEPRGDKTSAILVLILAALLIAGGRLLSWIINGFAEPKSPGG